ncbi:MAG: C25 family cysteine peptidase [Bacteroidota bacterium]|nr:C25 family cysteine peptidase [Bacteroidota bacterium]
MTASGRNLLLLCTGFLVLSMRGNAQDRKVTVVNDGYTFHVERIEGVDLFVIEGVAPSADEGTRVPARFIEVPCPDGNCPSFRISSYVLGEEFSASPYYSVRAVLLPDSTMVESVRPAPEEPDFREPVVLSQKVSRGKRGNVVRVEIPLVVFDAKERKVRWVERLDLVEERNAAFAPPRPLVSGPYIGQPFVRRGSRHLDTAGTWLETGDPAVRFFIRTDRLYALTKDWFEASGFPTTGVDPATIRLWRKGVEIPIYAIGLDDGSFDDGDMIIFRGERNYNGGVHRHVPSPDSLDEPYHEFLNIYSDSAAYWLTVGSRGGTRTNPAGTMPVSPPDTLDWAYRTEHVEYNIYHHTLNIFQDRIQNSDWLSEETWHGDFFKTNAVGKYGVRLSSLKEGLSGRLWVKVLSWYTDVPASPNFRVLTTMNDGEWLDSVEYDINKQAILETDVPAALLRGKDDTVKVWNKNIYGGTSRSEIVIDWFEVEYPSYITLEDGYAEFVVDRRSGTGPRVVAVRGVTDTDVVILRQRGDETAFLRNVFFDAGRRMAFFHDTLVEGSRYAISTVAGLSSPKPGTTRRVADLRTGADAQYLIITAKDLESAADEYARFIASSYGLKTRVVTVEDIYDNYSYGIFNPEAIKLFLFDIFRRETAEPPRFVFLVGDANSNYQDMNKPYSRNFVPSFGIPSSDTWFVCFDSLAVDPVAAIGRLPVATADEIRTYRDKHEAYLRMKPDLFNKSTIHFSGGDPSKGEGRLTILRDANNRVIRNVVLPPPLSGRAAHFYKTIDPPTNFGPVTPEMFVRTIAEGAVLISYIGHSGTDTWDNGISDPAQIANGRDRLSLITDFGCSSGKFSEPDIVSFSEKFVVRSDGQAIAYVGNSSLGFESTTILLPEEFYRALIVDAIPSIGEAHNKAKKAILDKFGSAPINRIAMRSNSLIGDPVIRIDFPSKPNFIMKPEWMRTATDLFTDAMDSLSFHIVYWNYGIAVDDSIIIAVEDIQQGNVLSRMEFLVKAPGLLDSLDVTLPRMHAVGARKLRLTLDAGGRIDELREDDNTAEFEYFVYSTHLKATNTPLGVSTGSLDRIAVLNPLTDPGPVSEVVFDFDASPDFPAPTTRRVLYGKTQTVLGGSLGGQGTSKVYWRAALDAADRRFAGPFSYWPSLRAAPFVQRDSADFSHSRMVKARYDLSVGVTVLPPSREIRVTSAGWADGSFATVEVDGFNVLATTYFIGYAVVVFDSLTLEEKRQRLFFTYDWASEREAFRGFLDSIETGEIAVIAAAHEPSRGIGVFGDALRALGSRFVDTVAQRGQGGNWALIGHRGAATGTVPEAFRPQRTGRVVVDTSFSIRPDTGFVWSPLIGPAAAWRSVRLERTARDTTTISVSVFGVDTAGTETGLVTEANPDTLDLSWIDAARFPFLKLRAALAPGFGTRQPAIRSWAVDYAMDPELAMNYQSVAVHADTVEQGEPARVLVSVLNAGASIPRDFPVRVDIVGEDNIRRNVAQYAVRALAPGSRHDTTVSILTDQLLRYHRLIVTVDGDDVVREQFEDNNVAETRFFVRTDTSRPSLQVLFNGLTPMNGDIVPPNPRITCTLRDASPKRVTSCDAFSVTIDGERVSCTEPFVAFTPAGSTTDALLVLTPTLSDGEHIFTFNAVDANGNVACTPDMEMRVKVVSETGIRDVYAYPTPFRDRTVFTFVLTGTSAYESLEIKIYTVAGRLVRTLSAPNDFRLDDIRIGPNAVPWDGKDAEGDRLANGVYFYKIVARSAGAMREYIGRVAVLR